MSPKFKRKLPTQTHDEPNIVDIFEHSQQRDLLLGQHVKDLLEEWVRTHVRQRKHVVMTSRP
jgi:hypothetical protein